MHQVNRQTKEHNELKEKLVILEKVVFELTNKVVNMETKELEHLAKVAMLEKAVGALSRKVPKMEIEVKDIKKNITTGKTKEKQIPSKIIKEKEGETEMVDFNINDIKDSSSTPKDKKDKVTNSNDKDGLLVCKDCNYKCKKKTSLEKHFAIKHEEHPCKECQEKLPSFTGLLNHIAKYHYQEQGDGESEDDAILGKRDLIEDQQGDKVSSFIFDKSMLNEFL